MFFKDSVQDIHKTLYTEQLHSESEIFVYRVCSGNRSHSDERHSVQYMDETHKRND